ncbi:retrotransposon protein, putative, ty1-copia subclass [Tanacetum coccineum]
MGYSFYYPPENKVLVARNAKFFKNSLITQEASESLEDLEIIQDGDMHPFENTSLHHDEYDQEINEPQSDIIHVYMFTRTRHALDRMCLYIDAKEHELGDLKKLANYKAALLDLEYDKWLAAVNVEMQSMKDNQVWDLVDLPLNSKTVGSKWLFKNKTDMDSNIHTYKARIVVKGLHSNLRGEAAYVLGIKSYIDRSRRLIGLCQSAYIEKILKRFHMENSKSGSIPMQDKPKLCKSQDA